MKILITGATGFIGRRLSKHFGTAGNSITPLGRKDFALSDTDFLQKVDGHDIIIHLAGAPLAKRWTPSYIDEIVKSRIETTRKVVNAINASKEKPSLFISSSAVGIYEEKEVYSEANAVYSNDFIGKLCQDWEMEAFEVREPLRTVVFRIGVVLDSKEGALKKMLPPFKLGLGGPIGNGKQLFSWIHISDLLSAFQFVIDQVAISGVMNLTSPQTVSNMEFTKTLGEILKRPTIIPIPTIILKLIYGKGAALLTKSQGAFPGGLLDAGFKYKFSTIKSALEDLIPEKN